MNNNDKNKFNESTKFFFIGWLIAIIPYASFLYLLKNNDKDLLVFKQTLIVLLIIVPILNGFLVSKTIKKLKHLN